MPAAEPWRSRLRRAQALGGIAGPVAFVAAWATMGTLRAGYSPVHDPISRLAAVGAPSRVVMTAGFLAFGAGVGLCSPAVRTALGRGPAVATAAAAAASVGIAALPLGSRLGDGPHAAAAGLAYAALAAAPLLAAPGLARRGNRRAAQLSVAAGLVAGAFLAASAVIPRGAGLAQRLGLTVADVWIVATAVAARSGCWTTGSARTPRWRRPSTAA